MARGLEALEAQFRRTRSLVRDQCTDWTLWTCAGIGLVTRRRIYRINEVGFLTSNRAHTICAYFFSSQDQTTRIHGPVGPSHTWHELARPQVHGYDLTDAAFVGPGALRLISSAEEKIARVFDAPKGFVRAVRSLGTVEWGDEQADEVGIDLPYFHAKLIDLNRPSAP
jgi:hypothetical protein